MELLESVHLAETYSALQITVTLAVQAAEFALQYH